MSAVAGGWGWRPRVAWQTTALASRSLPVLGTTSTLRPGQGRDSGQRRVAGQHRLRVVGRLGEVGGRRRHRSVPADGCYRRTLRASRSSAQGGTAARNGFGGGIFGLAAQFVHDRSERQCRWWLGLYLAGGADPNFGRSRGVERPVATVAECSTDRYTVCVQAARELPPELRGGRSMSRAGDDAERSDEEEWRT
jgi:hypothetical protein